MTSRRTFLAGAAAVPVVASLSTLPAAAASRISKMARGTNLKAEPSNTVAPAHPLGSAGARESMRDFRRLGGTDVALVIPLVQTSMRSSVITRRADTPSDTELRRAIRNARTAGLRVTLKPLLEVREAAKVPRSDGHGTFDSKWRGRIDPTDEAEWFDQYAYWLRHYAVIGQEEGAYSITLGTEMVSLTKKHMRRWENMARWVHAGAPNIRLGYAANRTGEVPYLSRAFLRLLKDFGVTFYPKFDLDRSKPLPPQLAKQLKGLTANLKRTAKRWGGDVTIYEWGVRSRQGTLVNTSDGTPGPDSRVDLEEQRVGYEALLTYFNGLSVVNGLFLWHTNTDDESGGEKAHDYTYQGKPAKKVLAKWFGGRA